VSASWIAIVMAALAGVAGAAQVAVMGKFGERVGVVAALAFSTAVTAVLALFALIVATRSLNGYADAARQPAWLWLGGAMGLFVVLSITFAGPRIGITATVALLIAGQLAAAVVIDRFGLFGAEAIGIGWRQVAGVWLLAVGAALTVRY
jgi:bacterial/archaeal transporter family-2 protein